MSPKPELKVGDVVALLLSTEPHPEWYRKRAFGVVTDRDGGGRVCVKVHWVLIGRTGWYLADNLEKLGEVEDGRE
jgi:hypothetical protein